MVQQFLDFWEKNGWFQGTKQGLLALSGGLDSMVLAHLLLQSGKDFGIAHCNFQLRGADSDGDQSFVQEFAAQHDLPFHTISFDTQTYADNNKQSIQLAARELRYEWLESIRAKQDYHYILTAHHLNDSLETVLYNLTKGTGIRGLHGIPTENEKVIRPLLFATRSSIQAYGDLHQVPFREDRSNADTKYRRNLLRKEVVPVLKKINPALEKTFGENIERFKEIEWLYEYALRELQRELQQYKEDQCLIDFQKLSILPARKSILFEWLRPFGFHSDQVDQVFDQSKTASGRIFRSLSHELLVNRDQLILRAQKKEEEEVLMIDKKDQSLKLTGGQLKIQLLDHAPSSFPTDANYAYLSYAKLQFPLRLRRWKPGDVFQPFGLKGHHQKLQDFFNNTKLSRFEKEQIWILESGGEIAWIVGHRLDERFRIADAGAAVLKIHWDTSPS